MKITRRYSLKAALAAVVAFVVSPLKGREDVAELTLCSGEQGDGPHENQLIRGALIDQLMREHSDIIIHKQTDGSFHVFSLLDMQACKRTKEAFDAAICEVFCVGRLTKADSPNEAIAMLLDPKFSALNPSETGENSFEMRYRRYQTRMTNAEIR